MTSTLFKLPFSLLCNILSKFLTVDSLSIFDIAVGETESRELVLESLFPSAEFVVEDNIISREGRAERNIRRDGRSFLYWVHKRRLNIRYVDLRGWHNITEEGLGLLSERCWRLQKLNLSGLREEVTDLSVSRLAEGCSMLQELSLEGCSQVTDLGLSLIHI